MTLSRFLRDYLYIPLGGNRAGPWRRHLNLLVTMLLGGLWHGAGWTFVIWGGLHGLYLIVNHVWGGLKEHLRLPQNRWWTRLIAWSVTFFAVVVAWVFFRAESLDAALIILNAMIGSNGVSVPADWVSGVHWRVTWLLALFGVQTEAASAHAPDILGCVGIGLLILVAARMPNTQRIMNNFRPALDYPAEKAASSWWRYRLSSAWVGVTVTLLAAALTRGEAVSEFLYFQF